MKRALTLILFLSLGLLALSLKAQWVKAQFVKGVIYDRPTPLPPQSGLFLWWDSASGVSVDPTSNRVTNWVDKISGVALTNLVTSTDRVGPLSSNCVQFSGEAHQHLATSNNFAFGSNLALVFVLTNSYLNAQNANFNRLLSHGNGTSGFDSYVNSANAASLGGEYCINSSPYGSYAPVNTNATTACMVIVNMSNGVSRAYSIDGSGSPFTGGTGPTDGRLTLGQATNGYASFSWFGYYHILVYTNTLSLGDVTNCLAYFSNSFSMTP